MSIKKIFRFSYRTGLDAEACKERLTNEYKEKMAEQVAVVPSGRKY